MVGEAAANCLRWLNERLESTEDLRAAGDCPSSTVAVSLRAVSMELDGPGKAPKEAEAEAGTGSGTNAWWALGARGKVKDSVYVSMAS